MAYDVTIYGCVIDRRTPVVPDGVEILESRWFAVDELDDSALAPDMAEIVPAAFRWFRAKRNPGG